MKKKNAGSIELPAFFMDLAGIEPASEILSLVVSPITADSFSFPLPDDSQQSSGFSSFILRLHTQSFAYIVSCNYDVVDRICRCVRAASSTQAATATVLLSAFKFKFQLIRSPACGWLPRLQKPRRNQYKPKRILLSVPYRI